MTSHDVVDAVRRIVHIRRVGHAGTLDPLATGVLVVMVGTTTRLARFLSGALKSYHAVIRLGVSTTTYDAAGEVVAHRPVAVERATVAAALAQFRGTLQQTPPMYSALKVRGEPLYKLARQGREIERPPREVTVHELRLMAWNPPELTIEVVCSAGTYVRSLAHDLGELLGCGAHLTALTRTASGSFRIAGSLSLAGLHALAEHGCLAEALLPPQAALTALPTVHLTPEQVRAVCHGRSIALEQTSDAGEIQAWDEAGNLVAVLIPVAEGRWRPNLVLAQAGAPRSRG